MKASIVGFVSTILLIICGPLFRAFGEPTTTPSAPDVSSLRSQASALKYSDPKQSAALYGQAAALDTAPLEKAADLDSQAEELVHCSDMADAQTVGKQAYDLQVAGQDHAGQARTSTIGARMECGSGDFDAAQQLCTFALAVDRKANATGEEAKALLVMGIAYGGLGQTGKAIDCYSRALQLFRKVGDRGGEADTLNNLGNLRCDLSEFSQAKDSYNQALPIYVGIGDRRGQGLSLNGLCVSANSLSDYAKAIDYGNQALTIWRDLGDSMSEAYSLDNIGNAFGYLSNYAKAIDFYKQALPILLKNQNTYGVAATVNGLGFAYGYLGQYAKAIKCYNVMLQIDKSIGNSDGQASALDNLGFVYVKLGEYPKAVQYSSQAVTIFGKLGNKDEEAWALGNVGYAYDHLGQHAKAIGYYDQALHVVENVGDRHGEARALTVIGDSYSHLREYAKAISFYNRALPISRSVGDLDDEADTLHSMLIALRDRAGSPRRAPIAAIVMGKQAVDLLQRIRSEISGMNGGVQKSFVKTRESTYRDLADILIAQGRLPEAEQVLGMLKEQEYFEFAGQDRAAAADLSSTVAFTPEEQKWIDTYNGLGDTVENVQVRVDALAKQRASDATEYKQAQARLASASSAYSSFLAELPKRFADSGKGQEIAGKLQDSVAVEDLLSEAQADKAGLRVCALYTVEADSQYDVVLVTPNGQRAGAYPITAAALNAKVEAFRQELADPIHDPRPLAKQLYDILVGPVAGDLDAYRPDLVMWSLDGALSLIPVSALWDGKQYLVQRWQSSLFNAASIPTLGASHNHNFTGALGMGVSQGRDVGQDHFGDLAGVPNELNGIFGDPSRGMAGPVQGSYLIDSQFKTATVLDDLRAGGHGLIHIATHFKLDPAGASSSYLLTGDGVLTLSDLAASGRVFRGVDLLTLSACSTAVGDRNALDATAQLLGAHAILATLWDVADPSTAEFMKTFYHLLTTAGTGSDDDITLAAAIRDAQLSLLGDPVVVAASPQPSTDSTVSRGSEAMPTRASAGSPLFKTDPAHPYAHPYYWAPFVLLGNWR